MHSARAPTQPTTPATPTGAELHGHRSSKLSNCAWRRLGRRPLSACFALLDALYGDGADIGIARNIYGDALRRLDRLLTLDAPPVQIREAAEAVGANQPFDLTYQKCNDRELQTTYGRMVSHIMHAACSQFAVPTFERKAGHRLFGDFVHEPYDFEALCRPSLGRLQIGADSMLSLGHPMTTGLPGIDYFLSSDPMKPPGAQTACTENLVRFPNLGVHCEPLREGPPQYDHLFPLIAQRVPQARFVFLKGNAVDVLNEKFHVREYGMCMDDHADLLPYQSPDSHHALNSAYDVFLDSIEWPGFNTPWGDQSRIASCFVSKGHMCGHPRHCPRTAWLHRGLRRKLRRPRGFGCTGRRRPMLSASA